MTHGSQRTDALRGRMQAWRVTTTLLLMAVVGNSISHAAEPKIKFNIPASTAPQAILDFAEQAKLQPLFFHARKVALIKTRAVVGEFEPAEALALMFKGTPLTFEFETEVFIAVRGPPEWDVQLASLASVDSTFRGAQSSWSTATAALPD